VTFESKHRAIGFNAFKMGEARDPLHGSKTALYSQNFAFMVQTAYDGGYEAARKGEVLERELEEERRPKVLQAELF
jgi:hypothetical protein